MGYCEYHGRIDPKDRVKIKNMFNDKNNIRGDKCKVIILSPSATEGIQLYNITTRTYYGTILDRSSHSTSYWTWYSSMFT